LNEIAAEALGDRLQMMHDAVVPDAQFRTFVCATRGVHAVTARTRRAFSRHSHEDYGIGVVAFGGQRSHSGRGQVEAGPGDAIAVNPGEVHDGAPVGGRARAWRMLYFEPRIIGAAAGEVFGASCETFELPRPVMADVRIASIFARLFEAESAPPDGPLRREELLLLLVAGAGAPRRPDGGRLSLDIAPAKSRIDDDPISPVSLAELALACGLDKFTLLRSFARATGLTPHAYLVQRRTDLVRRLIGNGMPLAQAAAEAGFCDQSHMTRTFVRKYGFTPGAYARRGSSPPQ
jgi:AraC-like DNA-binding protein